MNRFGDGGLLQRLKLGPDLNNSVAQEKAYQRFDEFALSRSFQGDSWEQRNKLLQRIRIATIKGRSE
jgi:hypothetical protein